MGYVFNDAMKDYSKLKKMFFCSCANAALNFLLTGPQNPVSTTKMSVECFLKKICKIKKLESIDQVLLALKKKKNTHNIINNAEDRTQLTDYWL